MGTITEISDLEIVTERVLVPEALIDIVELGDDDSLASLVASRVNPRVSISTFNGIAMDVDPASGPQSGAPSSRTSSSKARPRASRAFALGFAFVVVGLALGAGTGLAATGAAALLARPAPPPEELVFGASSLPPSFPPPLPLVRSADLEVEPPTKSEPAGATSATSNTSPTTNTKPTNVAASRGRKDSSTKSKGPALAVRAAAETNSTLTALISAEERARAQR